MSIAEVASSKARGSDTDGTAVVTLGASIAAGDTIVLDITERGAESATITGISDSVNGDWPAAIVGATDSAGATMRAWFYVFEGSGTGTPAITITTSGAASIEATAVGLHGTDGTPVLDVLGTTYNTAGAAEAEPNTAAVSATAAGIIVAGINTNVYQGSAPTEGGGAAIGPASTADGRSFMATRAVAGAGSEDFAFTAGSSTRWIVFQATFIEDAGVSPPSIIDVDEDNTVTLEQANVEIDGADFDTATVDLEQGSETYSLSIDSQNATAIVFDMEAVPGVAPKHGAATIRVTNGDTQDDTIAITIAADSGTDYVDIATVSGGTILEFSPALDTDDQVQWRVTDVMFDETDFNVNDDGTFDITEGLDPEDVEARRWDATNSTWSDWAAIVIDDGIEEDTTPDAFSFVDQFGVGLEAEITSAAITVSGIDAAADITVSGGTYSINGAAFTADAGTVNNGDEVRARHTSSDAYSTATNTTVTIGGVSDTFSSITGADPEAVTSHSHTASPGGMGRMMGRS